MIKRFTYALFLVCLTLLSSESKGQTIIYSEAFPAGTPATSVCTNWNTFRAALVPLPYVRMRFSGSASSTVFECTNPTIIADIALKLRTLPTPATANAFSWVDGTKTWQLGTDISGRFGVNTTSLSNCDNPGFLVKPCIGSANWGGFGTATCGGPAQTITLEFFYGNPMNNASAAVLTSPVAFCAGTQNIEIKVKNTGHNLISNVQIDWLLDGVPQSTVYWNNPIDTAGSIAGNEALVSLGSAVFGNTPRTIKAWTTMPNGVADTSNYDDTLSTTLRSSMQGLFTIGGASANYPTFAAAAADLALRGVCGPVNFSVNPGTYTEQLILNPIVGASATNTITFDGNSAATLSYASSATGERAVVKLNGADYVNISNFTINASGGTYGYGVHLMSDANNNVISNCNIITNAVSTSTTNYVGVLINSASGGITTTGTSLCDSNLIFGNTITGGYAGISVVANGSTSQVLNNIITGNEIKEFYLYGVYLNGNNGTVLENNNIHRPTRTAVSEYRGIYMTANSQNCKISRNWLHDPFAGNLAQNSAAFAINLNLVNASAGNENVVSNNVVYNFISNQTTANMNGVLINNSTYTRVYYNTINLDHAAAVVTTGGTRGIYVQAPVASNGIDIKNNIITISRGGAGPKQCIYFEGTGISLSSNYNDLLLTSTTGTVQLAYANGAGYTNLPAWQQGTGQDLNSVSADPQYTSPSTGNLTPTSSAVDNIGTPIASITTDIYGLPRSATTPDMGAFETSTPLAPFVLNFAANLKGEDVSTDWTIASEDNVLGYDLERSTDGKSFSTIEKLSPARIAAPASYQTVDLAPFSQTHVAVLYYRVRAEMKDGRSTYSWMVQVVRTGKQEFLVTAFPNPVGESLHISITGTMGANPRLVIRDLAGRTIRSVIPVGAYTEIDIKDLVKASYLLLYEDDVNKQSFKLIKQ